MPHAAAARFLNSRDRGLAHMAAGLAVIAGTALAASAVAGLTADRRQAASAPDRPHPARRRRGAFGLLGPAMMSATTLAGMRAWNAPSGPARTGALRLWGASQAVSAFWLAARPRSRAGQMLAAMMSAGMAAAVAHEARGLGAGAGLPVALKSPGARLGALIGRRPRRSPPPDVTVH